VLAKGGQRPTPRKKAPSPVQKPLPVKAKPQSKITQVQHDALLAGGSFTVLGGLLMLISVFLPWINAPEGVLGALDLLDRRIVYLMIPAVSVLGAVLMALSTVSLAQAFRLAKITGRAPLVQMILAMVGSLLLIAVILLLQKDYEGQSAFYGAGAFLDVVGAILAMAGSMLIRGMSGRVAKQPTGFQALAQRSMRPAGKKGWELPETSVKPPRCPSCGEELRPGWKACPACGYALISDEREERGSL
jgi:hypothetical protein